VAGKLERDISLKIPENPKPPGSAEYVVVVVQLEVVMGGHGMVDPPKPCGDEIGEEHVDGVMASRHHQRGHTNA